MGKTRGKCTENGCFAGKLTTTHEEYTNTPPFVLYSKGVGMERNHIGDP